MTKTHHPFIKSVTSGSHKTWTRCQECGDPVSGYFDHIDRDCTGVMPLKVAAGQLLPPYTPDERRAAIAAVTGAA